MRWSPEGYMFVSFGDGAVEIETSDVSLRALDIDKLGGKLIRIDRETGDGVPGNPYYDPQHPHSVRSRVWTYGFAQPLPVCRASKSGILYRQCGRHHLRDAQSRVARSELLLAMRGGAHRPPRLPGQAALP